MIKFPFFWYKIGIVNLLLWPFSQIYYLVDRLRSLQKPYKSKLKVICVGNYIIGGAGKTPTAIAVAKLLINNGKKVAFLSRGYLGNYRSAIKISQNDSAALVGDEALLLVKIAPTYLSRNRAEAAKLAEKDDIDILIMDDGLQHYTLFKDFKILVIDAERAFGNGLIIPAGPLRQKYCDSKIDMVIIIGNDTNQIANRISKPVFYGEIKPITEKVTEKFIAFAAIANPNKFFTTLISQSYDIIETRSYADHYSYKYIEVENLINYAKSLNASLITTEKDWVKLDKEQQKIIKFLPIYIEFSQSQQLLELCQNKLFLNL